MAYWPKFQNPIGPLLLGMRLANVFFPSFPGFPYFPLLLQWCEIGIGRQYQYVSFWVLYQYFYFPLPENGSKVVDMRERLERGCSGVEWVMRRGVYIYNGARKNHWTASLGRPVLGCLSGIVLGISLPSIVIIKFNFLYSAGRCGACCGF